MPFVLERDYFAFRTIQSERDFTSVGAPGAGQVYA
jgi:hypothetical protein